MSRVGRILVVIVLAGLASSPAAPAATTVAGRFVVMSSGGPGPEAVRYGVETGDRLYLLRGLAVHKFRPQQRVAVTGTVSGDTIDVASITATAAAPAQAAAVIGTHSVLVIMVWWPGQGPDSLTAQQAVNQIAGPDDAFYRESSYGALGLTATATGWLELPAAPSSCDDLGTLQNGADAAARSAGYDPGAYDHDMIYVSCGGRSWGNVGGKWTWIQGAFNLYRTAHELGHNLGLNHAHSLFCTGADGNQVALSDNCILDEYGDSYDIMGYVPAGENSGNEVSGSQKNVLGWLGGGRLATVPRSTSATYTLAPYEQQTAALQVLHLTTGGRSYWLEYRRPIGFDATQPPGVQDGVLIHLNDDASGGTASDLLDMTPGAGFPSVWVDPALPVGATWVAPEGASVKVNSAGPAGVSVTVNGVSPGTPGPPAVTIRAPWGMTSGTPPAVSFTAAWTQGTCHPGAIYAIGQSVDGGPFTPISSGTALSAEPSLYVGHTYRFRTDCGGAAALGPAFTLNGRQEGAATYSGTWHSTAFAGAWGGTARYTTAKGAAARFTCVCQGLAWVADEDSHHGAARVYVDGVLRATVNTRNPGKRNRVVVFRAGWPAMGTHTIRIVNVATSGHPRLTVDGFITRRAP
jgi:hypothetical protein